jgi:hypothetical protein
MTKRWSFVIVVFALSLGAARAASAQWMSQIPRATFGGYPTTFFDACNNMGQWQSVRSVTSYLGSFLGDLWAGDDQTLATCFANMSAAGLQLTIEAAAFQPPPTPGGCGLGADCYNFVAPILTRMRSLGAPAMWIRMQEPLTVGRQYGWAQDDIVNQTVIFIQALRANFPGIHVVSVEAYPYNSGSLLTWWIPALTNACVAAGVQPPEGFEVDHDLNASGTIWSDVSAIRDQAHAQGWYFGYIFGSPLLSGHNWGQTALTTGTAVWNFGIAPDIYTFESWERNPADPLDTIPEDTTSYTFMSIVRFFRTDGLFPR